MNLKYLFDVPDGVYALSHSVGACTKSAQLALQKDYIEPWQQYGGDAWPQWIGAINEFCTSVANVIHAKQSEICPQPHLAAGFHAYLTAICKQSNIASEQTILMHQDAFASMGFVVQGMASTYNIKLTLVEGDPNSMATWKQYLEKGSVLACLFTHVHSNTSVKSNITELVNLAKQYNARTMVDIAQSIGIVEIDMKKWGVDAAFGSCVKWLCGGPGAGFMYINQTNLKSLEPDPVGWFSHENPFEFDINHFKYADTAMRFWGGTPSIAPYVMAKASINQMLSIGLPKLVTHNLNLKTMLLDELTSNKTIKPLQYRASQLGGSLCLCPLDIETTSLALDKYNVKYDRRDEVIRISLHIFNTQEDAEIIASCFK